MLDGVRLADSVIDEIDSAFGVRLDREWSRLRGGDESAAFRCGEVVVRVGPTWRSDAELLARLHRAMAATPWRPRPPGAPLAPRPTSTIPTSTPGWRSSIATTRIGTRSTVTTTPAPPSSPAAGRPWSAS